MGNSHILAGRRGYLKNPIICSWVNCSKLVYPIRTRYCKKHREENKRIKQNKHRKSNVEKYRKWSRDSWHRNGLETRKKLEEKEPHRKKEKVAYMKEWHIKNKHQCDNCSKLVSHKAIYCKKCSSKILKRGFVKHLGR